MTSTAGAPLGPHSLVAELERARHLGFLGPGPVEDHIRHAAGFLAALESVSGTVIDLGSGGGVPGLVVGLARPDLRLVLVEATAKRCRFLESACHRLALPAEVIEARAEHLGRGARRGTADAVIARSFGTPGVTVECGAPLLRVGGCLVVSEPPEPAPERWPTAPLAALGLEVDPRPRTSPAVQVLRQLRLCPDRYPRRVGVPAKRPLF